MITISLIFILNILIAFTKRKQVSILFLTLGFALLSLYFFTSKYSVDYNGYFSYWEAANEDISESYIAVEVTFLYLIRLLRSLSLTYISLPITILIFALVSSRCLFKKYKNSSGFILSTLSYPFILYLSFHSFRQSFAISILLIAFSFSQSGNRKINNSLVFFY